MVYGEAVARPHGYELGDLAGALDHFTVLRDAAADRPPSRALAEGLYGRTAALNYLGRGAEAAADARHALAVAREIGYPTGEATALMVLSHAARVADRADEAIQLAWQAVQVDGDITGVLRRVCSWTLTHVLIDTRDFAAAEPICAAALAQAQEVGDLEPDGPAEPDGRPGPAGRAHPAGHRAAQ